MPRSPGTATCRSSSASSGRGARPTSGLSACSASCPPACCCFPHAALPRSRATALGLLGVAIYAAGYLAAAAFPCDLGCRPEEPSISQILHNLGGLAGYLLAPAFLFPLARAARAWPGAKSLVAVGYLASALALVGLLTLSPSSPAAGLGQRLLELAVLGWVALCGLHLAKRAGRGA